MSEYQYYEFLAIDRPLDDAEQAEIRSLSTRATITATSFVNEYHWGDFKGDPTQLMRRYYDAHLYVANWGTHRIMFRLPRTLLDPATVADYQVEQQVTAHTTGEFVVLDITSEDHNAEFDFDYDPATLLSALVGVRTELALGDLRPLYLAWLAAYGTWERDEDVFDRDADDDLEPPVPPGLATLTAPQRALAEFLRLDEDLLAVAARTSPAVGQVTDDPDALATWITRLPGTQKNRLLVRVMRGEATRVHTELLRRFRDDTTPNTPRPPRRTVATLLDDAGRQRSDRQRRVAAARADEEARQEQARALARARRLDRLAGDREAAWARVETMIDTRKPAEYDAAVTLLTDLQALAERDGDEDAFTARARQLRQAHARKPSLIDRLDRAGI
jgi:hypothetical protein